MRYLLLALLMVGLAGLGGASDLRLSSVAPDKDTYIGDGAYDGREGGETFATAVVIGALPYTDSGATCDNTDDIILTCLYGTSIDVVYKYTAVSSGFLSVSLCGSAYDTGLGIFDDAYNMLYCNDDFCGLQSQIDFAATAGATYYFVIDGYNGACGSYLLNVTSGGDACDPACPAGGIAEGEPACGPDYYDAYNGGCNSTGWTLLCPTTGTDAVICGMSGTYVNGGTSTRDTDWFQAYGTGGAMTATVCADFPVQLLFIYGTSCTAPEYDAITGQPGQEVSLSRNVAAGVEVWIWVGPSGYTGVACESPYLLTMSGIATSAGCGPTATERTTFGRIKSLYR